MHDNTPTSATAIARSQPSSDPAHCAAAALHLMSHYAEQPCPLVAHAIAGQLRLLSRNCVDNPSSLLQSLASALMPRWHAIARGAANTVCH